MAMSSYQEEQKAKSRNFAFFLYFVSNSIIMLIVYINFLFFHKSRIKVHIFELYTQGTHIGIVWGTNYISGFLDQNNNRYSFNASITHILTTHDGYKFI